MLTKTGNQPKSLLILHTINIILCYEHKKKQSCPLTPVQSQGAHVRAEVGRLVLPAQQSTQVGTAQGRQVGRRLQSDHPSLPGLAFLGLGGRRVQSLSRGM